MFLVLRCSEYFDRCEGEQKEKEERKVEKEGGEKEEGTEKSTFYPHC